MSKLFTAKNRYVLQIRRVGVDFLTVEATSPEEAASLVPAMAELETVRPLYGRDDETLISAETCAFCPRHRLAGIDGYVGEDWYDVPVELMDIPFGQNSACPECAKAKGLLPE